MIEFNNIYNGDCLELMKNIPDGSVDMILCDLPYGTTACKWDVIIPFGLLWDQYKRITKPNSVIILTGSQPFSSFLISSNPEWFKYEWIWEKEQGTGQNLCGVMPLKKHENILVFKNCDFTEFAKAVKYARKKAGLSLSDVDKLVGTNTACSWWEGRKSGVQLPSEEQYKKLKDILSLDSTFDNLILKKRYIPQMSIGDAYTVKRHGKTEIDPIINSKQKKTDTINTGNRYPTSILKYRRDLKNRLHPTQKPVALFEYLIKTYTNEGDIVLDNCSGSGTTAIACINTNRNYICMEKDVFYYKNSLERIKQHTAQTSLFQTA